MIRNEIDVQEGVLKVVESVLIDILRIEDEDDELSGIYKFIYRIHVYIYIYIYKCIDIYIYIYIYIYICIYIYI
jgi:hypothetical protein